MMKRIVKFTLIVVVALTVAQLQTAACRAWSLNPFASDEPEPKRTAVKRPAPPSTFDKLTTGTKNLFNKTGETLGLKKPEPKRLGPTAMAIPRQPQLASRKQTEQKSWLTSMFSSEKEKKEEYKGVTDWMSHTQRIDP